MYLAELKLWNFRKYGNDESIYTAEKTLRKPDLTVPFVQGINVLIGENDSGKTAIIDAIKLALKTHSYEWIKPQSDDFYEDSLAYRIECHFEDLESKEAKNFIEWLTIYDEEKKPLGKPKLKVILEVKRNEDGKIFNYDVKAGPDDFGRTLDAEAREYLQTTYLKPLRDAKNDFESKRNSRFSQILQGHDAFKEGKNHYLVALFEEFNQELKIYFDGQKSEFDKETGQKKNTNLEGKDLKAKEVKETVNRHLNAISGMVSELKVTNPDIKSILETLSLTVIEKNSGLGTFNKLYIAAELLHLEKENWDGIRLGLIEEIEAHLHPQAQMRVIEHFQKQVKIQFILTTHSPNLASKVDLNSLIICEKKSNQVFSLRKGFTQLESTDYSFLKRFLDTTKANLFFAKGVIMVEGWAEELFIPTLAKRIGYDLTERGVSVVNVGGTSFLRYSKIFQRRYQREIDGKNVEIKKIGNDFEVYIEKTKVTEPFGQKEFSFLGWVKESYREMSLPVSVITDVDLKPIEGNAESTPDVINGKIRTETEKKEAKYNGQTVQAFVSPYWTLEYCLAYSDILSEIFFTAVKKASKEMNEDSKSVAEIADDYSTFKNDSPEQKAYRIYQDYVLERKISKSIIAQYFAEELKISDITKDDILGDKSIEYLIKAIKHACGD